MGQATPYAVGAIVVFGSQNYKVVRTMDNGWTEPTNTWFWSTTTDNYFVGTTPPAGTPATSSRSPLVSPVGGNGMTMTTFGGSPAYLSLKNSAGAQIDGSVQKAGLEKSIEVFHIDQKVELPIDPTTGQFTGVRRHSIFKFVKMINKSSPFLFKAVTTGETLKEAVFKFYETSLDGAEVETYNVRMDGVKVVSLRKINTGNGYAEEVGLRFAKITETFLDGNLQASDDWSAR